MLQWNWRMLRRRLLCPFMARTRLLRIVQRTVSLLPPAAWPEIARFGARAQLPRLPLPRLAGVRDVVCSALLWTPPFCCGCPPDGMAMLVAARAVGFEYDNAAALGFGSCVTVWLALMSLPPVGNLNSTGWCIPVFVCEKWCQPLPCCFHLWRSRGFGLLVDQ